MKTKANIDASVKPKDEKETERLDLAQGSLAKNLLLSIDARRIFKTVTTKESDVPKEGKALKLQATILKFSRGSSSARFAVGFGAGMPYVKVRLVMKEIGTEKRCSSANSTKRRTGLHPDMPAAELFNRVPPWNSPTT